MKTTHEIRIYVACLKAYNNGKLHGEWVDATQNSDDIYSDVAEMLEASPEHTEEEPCEEWAIHDYEGFGDISISEHTGFDEISELAQAIEEHGDAWLAYVSDTGAAYATQSDFKNRYIGEAESEKDFVENMYHENGMVDELPEWARNNIDWEGLAHDLFIDSYTMVNGHVFSKH